MEDTIKKAKIPEGESKFMKLEGFHSIYVTN